MIQTYKISSEQYVQEGTMQTPEEVDKILVLHSIGWGTKRIARELGISKNTVKRYLKLGKWQQAKGREKTKLDGLQVWLRENFEKHRGNADVIRQELLAIGIKVSLRTVQRAVQGFRREALVKAKATIRFETPPGKQLQIDFGSTHVLIGNEKIRVYLFVATLGYSRRIFIAPFLHERQSKWLEGIERAFQYFGGVPEQVLLDNPKALVNKHNIATKELIFNERFKAFANYWGFRPVACAPYRARTKGKDERSIGYVKRNAIAGHTFLTWAIFEAHLHKWMMEIADVRIHGTTEEKPIERFLKDEVFRLSPLNGKPPFLQIREVTRIVQADACIEVDSNFYSVPWHLIKASVTAQIIEEEIKIFYDGQEVAKHMKSFGRRERIIDPPHLKGIIGYFPSKKEDLDKRSLMRPLSEYEEVVEGIW
jgi:transposase